MTAGNAAYARDFAMKNNSAMEFIISEQATRRPQHVRDADLLCLPRHPLAEDPHKQSLERVMKDDCDIHRCHRVVRQTQHEHAAARSVVDNANRSRRVLKCAKYSGI
jgi:hypothetical protein